MEPERWERIEQLFCELVDLEPDERAARLDAECEGDPELRAEVERMLAGDASGAATLDELESFWEPRREPWIGRELGPYQLTERLAEGGMGVVYRARRTDGLFEREVAVKLIRADARSTSLAQRFERERRTLASLDHPNIARLYDGGSTPDGAPYLVMELIDGVSIDRHCREARLSLQERLELFRTVCLALHFAHKNLVVHCDLKPGNILVDAEGVPKVLDFGIARLLEDSSEDHDEGALATVTRVLTPAYASPEQLAGAPVTTATDIYSLGVLLYLLLTGQRPLETDSRSAVAWERLVLEGQVVRPSTRVLLGRDATARASEPVPESFAELCGTTPRKLRQRLTGDLDRIVLMALRKEPERRYASAKEFADDIENHLRGRPVQAREDTWAYRASHFVRRHRVGVAAAVIVLSALTFGWMAARRGERLAREQAEHTRIEASSFHSIADFLTSTFLTTTSLSTPGRRERARESIRMQAERARALPADSVHLKANLLDALGGVCLQLDLLADADELIREALELRRLEFGDESLEHALSLTSLGRLYFRGGEFRQAAEALRRSLDLQRSCPVDTHTDVATAANDLATALRNLGALDEAETLHLEALELRRAQADGTLPVAESLNNLAGIRLDREQFAEAEVLLREALDIRRRTLGDRHPLTLQTGANLANPLWLLGRREEADERLREVVLGFRSLEAEGRLGLAMTLSAIATMRLEEGRVDEVEEPLAEAIDIQVECLGPDHPAVAASLKRMAEFEERLELFDSAEQTWLEVIRIWRAVHPTPHRSLGEALQSYGNCLSKAGRIDDGLAALREGVDVFAALPDPDARQHGRGELKLALALQAAGRTEEARERATLSLELLDGSGASEYELSLARGVLGSVGTAPSGD